MKRLYIVQGDTLKLLLTLEKPISMEISEVMFECPSLGLHLHMTALEQEDAAALQEESGFILSEINSKILAATVEPEEAEETYGTCTVLPLITAALWVGSWDFTITVRTTDGDQFTVVPNGELIVKHKRVKSTPIPPQTIRGIGWTED